MYDREGSTPYGVRNGFQLIRRAYVFICLNVNSSKNRELKAHGLVYLGIYYLSFLKKRSLNDYLSYQREGKEKKMSGYKYI